MHRILVFDLPTRIFHWIFAATVVGALGLALTVDDDSQIFQLHMLLGLIAAFLAALRVVWGCIGTRYARFGSFLFGPKALFKYLLGVVRNTAPRHVGHNPGSAYATYAMLVTALGLAVTGPLLASWHSLGELHEVMAYVLMVSVAAHLAGLVVHAIRHRDNVTSQMLTGLKPGPPAEAIPSSHPALGLVLLALVAGWSAMIVSGHNATGRTLQLFGNIIRLGEAEGVSSHGHQRTRHGGGAHRGEEDAGRDRQGGGHRQREHSSDHGDEHDEDHDDEHGDRHGDRYGDGRGNDTDQGD